MPFSNFSGALQVSNGAVAGTLVPYNGQVSLSRSNTCSAVYTSLTATGTLNDAHDLALTFPIAGGTGILLSTLANDPATNANGTFQIAGGSCALSATSMIINQTSPTTPPPTPAAPTPITANLSGNWGVGAGISFPNTVAPKPVLGFGGTLQFSNGSVTGTLTPYVNFYAGQCYGAMLSAAHPTAAVPITATGSLDASNNLALTLPVAGGMATIYATLTGNPQTLADSTYQISGGSCAMSAVSTTMAQFAPVTGTYSGTFNVPDTYGMPRAGTDITVTAVLTQSTAANSSGQFPLTGTITATGACTYSSTITTGGVTGGGMGVTTNGGAGSGDISGSITPTASTIFDAYFNSSTCTSLYQGVLIRQ